MEIWKEIEGYNGYEVSNLGNVRRWHRWPNKEGIITFTKLKPNKLNKKNYYLIRLSKDSVQSGFLLHRLVAKAFVPNPNNYPIVMHEDNNGYNCKAENLKWGTISHNTINAYKDGLMLKKRNRTKTSKI